MSKVKNNDAFWPISRQPQPLVDRAMEHCKKNYLTKAQITRMALGYYLDNAEVIKAKEEEIMDEALKAKGHE